MVTARIARHAVQGKAELCIDVPVKTEAGRTGPLWRAPHGEAIQILGRSRSLGHQNGTADLGQIVATAQLSGQLHSAAAVEIVADIGGIIIGHIAIEGEARDGGRCP